MPLYSFEGKTPRVHPTAFIAPTAVIVGDVTIEENASVWYNAVVRADFSAIAIRRGANVQDGAVLHVTPLHGVLVGPGATVAHLCLIHEVGSPRWNRRRRAYRVQVDPDDIPGPANPLKKRPGNDAGAASHVQDALTGPQVCWCYHQRR